ncbi:MAG: tetratricopeptide repeat protein [Planctomycetota bacterium]
MQRDLVLTAIGVVAAGAVVFGIGLYVAGSMGSSAKEQPEPKNETSGPVAKEQVHPKEQTPGKTHSPAKDKEQTADQTAAQSPAASSPSGDKASEILAAAEELKPGVKELTTRYNDLLAKGDYDEAWNTARKALNIAGRSDPAWRLRLANATYLAKMLPAQKRYSEACNIYTELLARPASFADVKDAEWAQYRVCTCYRELGRWDEAMQAAVAFLDHYATSTHAPEIRLLHAQGLSASGKRIEAQEELTRILASNPPDEVKAQVQLRLAEVDWERLKTEPAEPPVQNATVKADPEETAGNGAPPVSATQPPETAESETSGLPPAEWAKIKAAAQRSDFQTAGDLLEAWASDKSRLTEKQRVKLRISYAKLLSSLPSTGTGK